VTARTLGILASGSGHAAAAATLLVALSLIGFAALPRRLRPGKAILALPLSLSLGSLLVGVGSWIVGWFLGTRFVLPLLALAFLASLVRAAPFARAARLGSGRLLLLLRSTPASLLLLLPLGALLPHLLEPLVDSDGIRYHVALPKLFDLTGHVFYYPWDVTGAFPQTGEMLYFAASRLLGGETAKFIHAGFFAASLGVLALTMHRSRSTRLAAVLAPFLFAASPVALAPAPAAFVDHIALFHLATAMLLLTRRAPCGHLGVALGAALATKLTSGPGVVGIGVAALLSAPSGRRVRAGAAVALPVVLAFAPYAIRNVRETGDPIYPIGLGLMGRPIPGVSKESLAYATRYHGTVDAPLGISWGPGDDVQPDEVAGWQHLAGFVAVALAIKEPATRPLLALVLPYVAVSIPFRPPTRYLLPMLFALSAFEGWAIARLFRKAAAPLALLIALPTFLFGASNLLTGFSALDYVRGRVDRETLLARSVPGYGAAAFVNAQPSGGRVMALDFPAPYYFDRPWIVEGVLNEPPLRRWLSEGAGADELHRRLRDLDVRYLVVTPGYGGGTPASLFPLARSRAEAEVVVAFRSRLRRLATIDSVDVYAVPRER
jgi:hypothetical protein